MDAGATSRTVRRLLLEPYAEEQFFLYDTGDDDTREQMKRRFVGLRLSPSERARLGARGTIFASREVNAVFKRFQAVTSQHSLFRSSDESERTVGRMPVGGARDVLQKTVRDEIGADQIQMDPRATR